MILVTGATGYIGSAVAEKLIARGFYVAGLARSERAESILRSKAVTPVRGNLDDLPGLTAVAQQADAVIHTAFQWGKDVPSSISAENAVIEALLAGLRGTAKPFIFTSGTSVLGDTGEIVFQEDTHIPPHNLNQRLRNEQLVLEAKDCHGVVIRPPNVYGRGDGHALFAALRSAGEKFRAIPYVEGSGDNLWSFVHVDDLATLFVLALIKSARGELYHAGAESGLRTAAIAAALSKGAGWNGKTVEMSLEVLMPRFPVSALAEYWSRNSQSSREKAERLLGWSPHRTNMLEELANESVKGNA